jgi:hypothetical protein
MQHTNSSQTVHRVHAVQFIAEHRQIIQYMQFTNSAQSVDIMYSVYEQFIYSRGTTYSL